MNIRQVEATYTTNVRIPDKAYLISLLIAQLGSPVHPGMTKIRSRRSASHIAHKAIKLR
jgi:hypothetical protein